MENYTGFLESEVKKQVAEDIKREAWLRQRLGKFTASEFHRLMAYEDKDVLPKGAETYALENAIELLTDTPKNSHTNEAMEWGNMNEVDAVELFAKRHNITVSDYVEQKFIELTKDIGGTPDGTIQPSSGVEVKCPNSKTHFGYLQDIPTKGLKAIESKYYWQIQGLMLITSSQTWWFVSYDPRFVQDADKLLAVEVERNEADITKLRERLKLAIAKKNTFLKSRGYGQRANK